jgi:hypothetical protein
MAWTGDDLRNYATVFAAIIALIALFRPDVARLIARYRLRLDVHPAAASRVEVGFSNFGPTIGLQGTIRAIGTDAFITTARIIIERVADHLRHEFDWAVFRQLALSASSQQGVELASGFALPMQSPRRFNVQFHDTATAQRYNQALIDLHQLWVTYLQGQGIILANTQPGQIRPLYDTFHTAENAKIASLYQLVEREFYWIEGTYRLTFLVRTSRPEREFKFDHTFDLTAGESASLRLNAIGCLLAACNVPDVIFNFAYARYAAAA